MKTKNDKKLLFNNMHDTLKFLGKDCWDTYKDLLDTKWKDVENTVKSKEIFVENKNNAVATLVMFYDAAINYLLECKKDLKHFTINDVE